MNIDYYFIREKKNTKKENYMKKEPFDNANAVLHATK